MSRKSIRHDSNRIRHGASPPHSIFLPIIQGHKGKSNSFFADIHRKKLEKTVELHKSQSVSSEGGRKGGKGKISICNIP